MLDENLTGHRVVLTELQNAFDKLWTISDTLDEKTQNIFNTSGVLIFLAIIGQVVILKNQTGVVFWVGFGVVMALYLAMYIVISVGLHPHTFKLPISMNWETLDMRYFSRDETAITEQLIADYIQVIKIAQGVIATKSQALNMALIFFILIMAVLLTVLATGIGV